MRSTESWNCSHHEDGWSFPTLRDLLQTGSCASACPHHPLTLNVPRGGRTGSARLGTVAAPSYTQAKDPPSLEQPQPSITTAGKHPKIMCIMRGSSVTDHVLSWYKQPANQGLAFLVSHREKGKPTYGEGISERFLPGIEKESKMFILTIGNTEKSDEGIYYCAIWYSNQYIFGDGTQVIFKDTSEIKKPKVQLLGPSPREVSDQDLATFICVADGYYPDVIRIKWWVNQHENYVDSEAHPSIKQKDDTSLQAARLTLQAGVWEEGAEVNCTVEHESGIQTLRSKTNVMVRRKQQECKEVADAEGRYNRPESSGNITSGMDSVIANTNGILVVAFYAYLGVLFASCAYGLAMAFCICQKRRLEIRKRRRMPSGHKLPSRGVGGRGRIQWAK